VRRRRDASPTILVQGTSRWDEVKEGGPHPSATMQTRVPSVQNPIVLTQKQYQALVEAGLLSDAGGPEQPASSRLHPLSARPAISPNSQPNRQVSE
jgi:hypothetical protein